MLTHGYWLQLGASAVQYGEFTPADVILSTAPAWYMDAMWHVTLALMAGAPLVILPAVLGLAGSGGRCAKTVSRSSTAWARCRCSCSSSRPIPSWIAATGCDSSSAPGSCPQLHQAFEERWGCPWREAYGTTEVGAGLMVPLDDDGSVGSGLMGRVVEHREARVVDPETDDAGSARDARASCSSAARR